MGVSSAKPNTHFPDFDNSQIITSLQGFDDLLVQSNLALEDGILAETRSVIEGAKALTRPQKRVIENPDAQRPAAALAALEAEIANFDQHQRRAALVTFQGPQRIRGLAGSGKTVILAMKAAHLHLNSTSRSYPSHIFHQKPSSISENPYYAIF